MILLQNFQISDVERIQQVSMVSGPEMNAAIHALAASRNFFNPNMIEAGPAYPQPDKKILHLG